MLAILAAGVPTANAAGIVTHAWMALEAIDRVQPPALRQLLDAHRDQVRAGAEFPDGGYWTRSLGTPGGDYGEEAHWQRFHDAYVAQIRSDPACAPLTDPAGPCAATIAHLMGAAAHGMGDEVCGTGSSSRTAPGSTSRTFRRPGHLRGPRRPRGPARHRRDRPGRAPVRADAADAGDERRQGEGLELDRDDVDARDRGGALVAAHRQHPPPERAAAEVDDPGDRQDRDRQGEDAEAHGVDTGSSEKPQKPGDGTWLPAHAAGPVAFWKTTALDGHRRAERDHREVDAADAHGGAGRGGCRPGPWRARRAGSATGTGSRGSSRAWRPGTRRCRRRPSASARSGRRGR